MWNQKCAGVIERKNYLKFPPDCKNGRKLYEKKNSNLWSLDNHAYGGYRDISCASRQWRRIR